MKPSGIRRLGVHPGLCAVITLYDSPIITGKHLLNERMVNAAPGGVL
jgi:hypothetical protein